MYLSRLKLNQARRSARELLLNPYLLHQAVYRAFPDKEDGGPGRVLYRVDESKRSNSFYLLVQSDKEPNWQKADFLTDCLAEPPKQKILAPSFNVGQTLYFRLRANPSVKKQEEGKKNGRRLGLLQEEDQLRWLKQKGESGGFALSSCDTVTEGVIQSEQGNPDKKQLRHFAVRFDGILRVMDAELFRKSVEEGIGPAKGFGFGLLSVASVRN